MAPNVDSFILIIEAACKIDQGLRLSKRSECLRAQQHVGKRNKCPISHQVVVTLRQNGQGSTAYSATRECAGKSRPVNQVFGRSTVPSCSLVRSEPACAPAVSAGSHLRVPRVGNSLRLV